LLALKNQPQPAAPYGERERKEEDMLNLSSAKIIRKLALLFALGMALIYLHRPDQASAQQSCLQACQAAFSQCVTACDKNTRCLSVCSSELEACDYECLGAKAR
jgi:hypothetical protein